MISWENCIEKITDKEAEETGKGLVVENGRVGSLHCYIYETRLNCFTFHCDSSYGLQMRVRHMIMQPRFLPSTAGRVDYDCSTAPYFYLLPVSMVASRVWFGGVLRFMVSAYHICKSR